MPKRYAGRALVGLAKRAARVGFSQVSLSPYFSASNLFLFLVFNSIQNLNLFLQDLNFGSSSKLDYRISY
jgi:hypothetical protein